MMLDKVSLQGVVICQPGNNLLMPVLSTVSLRPWYAHLGNVYETRAPERGWELPVRDLSDFDPSMSNHAPL